MSLPSLAEGIQEEQEHELGKEDGIDALIPAATVESGDVGAREGGVDERQHMAQRG